MIQLTPLDQTLAVQQLMQITRDEEKRNTARNLLSIGKLTLKEIARATGLTLNELNNLKKLNKK